MKDNTNIDKRRKFVLQSAAAGFAALFAGKLHFGKSKPVKSETPAERTLVVKAHPSAIKRNNKDRY